MLLCASQVGGAPAAAVQQPATNGAAVAAAAAAAGIDEAVLGAAPSDLPEARCRLAA